MGEIKDFSKKFKEDEADLDKRRLDSSANPKPEYIDKKFSDETGLPRNFTRKEALGYLENKLEFIAELRDNPEKIGVEGLKMLDLPTSLTNLTWAEAIDLAEEDKKKKQKSEDVS